MRTAYATTLAITLVTLGVTAAPAQESRTTQDGFTWSGRLPDGAWLRIHNYKGRVQVREAAGDAVEVRAEKRSSDGRLPEVEFALVRDGRNVTICAMPVEDARCEADGLRSRGSDPWRRASVEFTVLLPRGVRLHAGSGNGDVQVENVGAEVVATSGNGRVTVARTAGPVRVSSGNGDVEVREAGGPVVASSGNGSVRITTADGPVNASTGNGSIDVEMRRLGGDADMEFRTGNGRVTVRLPAGFQGEVDASTGNGRFTSDFPVTVQGNLSAHRVRGVIGGGGRRIRMSSGNGALELRRLE